MHLYFDKPTQLWLLINLKLFNLWLVIVMRLSVPFLSNSFESELDPHSLLSNLLRFHTWFLLTS